MSGKGNSGKGSSGGKSSGGGSSASGGGGSREPQVVSGWQYHTYSNGTAGDSSRYTYIGKDDDGTPEFIDYGPKGGR